MESQKSHLKLKSWSDEDKPREKLLKIGQNNLSTAELLAIIIQSGTRQMTAVDLSKQILASVSNNLIELSKLGFADLIKFKGIGEAKAISILAALELAKRRQEAAHLSRPKITSSNEAYHILKPLLENNKKEEFWVLLLNRANEVIGRHRVSVGGVASTVVDNKIIFKLAIENLASSLIVSHNHPSGNLKPSESDKRITYKLAEAGKSLDIKVLDHIIVSEKGYFSFKDEGLLIE